MVCKIQVWFVKNILLQMLIMIIPKGYCFLKIVKILEKQVVFMNDPFTLVTNHRINFVKQSLSREKYNIMTWVFFAFFVLYLFEFQSDGDFSFLLVRNVFPCGVVDVELDHSIIRICSGFDQNEDFSICWRYFL